LYFEGPEDQFYSGPVYMATNEKSLNEGVRRIDRMFVFLLSNRRAAPRNDWTVGRRFWTMLVGGSVEQLRESLGATNVHRSIVEAEEGLGDLPGITIFAGQPESEVNRRLDDYRDVFTCGQR